MAMLRPNPMHEPADEPDYDEAPTTESGSDDRAGPRPSPPTEPLRPKSPPSPMPPPELVAGRYRLVKRLAEGSFGVVYQGSYTVVDKERPVAIKLLKASALQNPAAVMRFREEARALARLNHPNICNVLDEGTDERGIGFLVMDFADGGSLKQALEASSRQTRDGKAKCIDPELALRWLREAAQGLQAAETLCDERGQPTPINHRDVKPENLLLRGGRVVVADFGAAKLNEQDHDVTSDIVPAVWTPQYGAPEQQHGHCDHRSDVYALGATFFQLLTGQPTRARFKDAAQRFREAHDPSTVNPDVPAPLGAVVRRMTEPEPERRHASFAELLAELDVLGKKTVFVRSRGPWWVAGVVLAVVGTLGGLEAAGFTDLLPKTIVVSDTEPSLRDRSLQCAGLERRLAALDAGTWQLFREQDAVRGQLAQQLAFDRRQIDELLTRCAPELRVVIDGFTRLEDIEARLDALVRDVAVLGERRQKLVDLRTDVARVSVAVARARLVRVRDELRQPPHGDALATLAQEVDDAIAAEGRRRDAIHGELLRRLWEGASDGFDAEVERAAVGLEGLGETELAIGVRRLREAAAFAATLTTPAWPPAGKEPAQCLDDLAAAIATCRATEGTIAATHPELQDGWRARLVAWSAGCDGRLLAWLEPHVAAHAAAVGAMNAIAAGDWQRDAYERLQAADAEFDLLRRRVTDLVAAAHDPAAAGSSAAPLLTRTRAWLRGWQPVTLRAPSGNVVDREAAAKIARARHVQGLEDRFGAGDAAAFDGLRREAEALVGPMAAARETELSARLQALLADLDAARAAAEAAPALHAFGAVVTLADLEAFVAAIQALAAAKPAVPAGAPSPPVAGWWTQWVRRRVEQAGGEGAPRFLAERQAIAAAIAQLGDAVRSGRGIPTEARELQRRRDGYEQCVARLREFVATSQLPLGAVLPVTALVPLPEVPVVAEPAAPDLAPDGWPADLQVPAGVRPHLLRVGDAECERLYAASFLRHAQREGRRLWSFPERRAWPVGDGRAAAADLRPVYMALVRYGEADRDAALVDVHPVTFGEIRQHAAFCVTPGPYWLSSFAGRRNDEFAFRASRQVGNEFAAAVGNLGGSPRVPPFELPTTALLQVLAARGRGPAPAVVPSGDAVPAVGTGLVDVTDDGIAGLRGGVTDVTRDGAFGTSAIPEEKPVGTPSDRTRLKHLGFRLVMRLVRR
jgi:hypothetical protein